MADTSSDQIVRGTRSDWVRLRTLVTLRWIAITGQIIAITMAQRLYNLQLELGLCYLAVGASVIANLIAVSIFPENKRLTESEAVSMILFDICQLSFLIFLTGGLNNPFALLILAPVTISATVLQLQSTVFLGVVSLTLTTLVGIYHIPLRTAEGFILRIPDIFLFGFWSAIVIGVVFIAIYARRVTVEMHSMSEALLATQMALAREQKLTDLGGVVAAAAHELGTPLATIKLVSAELMEELEKNPELKEDAQLIRDQADRCRDILQSMGRAGKSDLHMRTAPLSTVVQEAAEPHTDRGKDVHFMFEPATGGEAKHPLLYRRPEIIHGIRNLVQNAVDFSAQNVWIEGSWTETEIVIRITDDGPGFPSQVIGRLGDPFVRRRRSAEDRARRPGYEGMGLGLFIAKTLLERSGAELAFANGSDPFLAASERTKKSGAIVEAVWARRKISAESKSALGQNTAIRA
ncbi:MAG: ActS/PrrB/RegB family redox-sensitive histidine kinase [Pseudomonadota bacterium]